MKNQFTKNRAIWGIGCIAALTVCYVLCRHDVLGEWHSMIQWPLILYVIGVVAIIIAAFLYKRGMMLCTIIGYMAGFAAAMLFNSDYAGPGDIAGTVSYNNAWQIWVYVFIAISIIGYIWDSVTKSSNRQAQNESEP